MPICDATTTTEQSHGRHRFTLRTLLIAVAVIGGLLCFGKWAFRPEVRQIPFDSVGWKRAELIERSRTVRSQMIEDLLRRYDFQRWPRREVVQLLGASDSRLSFERWDVVYIMGLERGGWASLDTEALGFKFDANDRVIAFGVSVN